MDFPPRPPPVRPAAPIIGHRRCPMQHNIYSRALTGVRVRIIEQPAGPYFTSPILKARTRDRNRPRALLTPPEMLSPGSRSRSNVVIVPDSLRKAINETLGRAINDVPPGAIRVVAAVGTKVVGCAAATAKTNPPAGGDAFLLLASFPSGQFAAPRAPRAGFYVSE